MHGLSLQPLTITRQDLAGDGGGGAVPADAYRTPGGSDYYKTPDGADYYAEP